MRRNIVLRLARHTLRANLSVIILFLLLLPAIYALWLASDSAIRSLYSVASRLQIATAAIFGALAASQERRSGTLRILLAQPIRRATVVSGAFLSLAALCLVNAAVLAAVLIVESVRAGAPISGGLAVASFVFGFLRPLAISSVAFLLASVTSPWISATVAFALPIVYWMTGEGLMHLGGLQRAIHRVLRWVLPSLEQLDLYRCLALRETPSLFGGALLCVESLSFIGLLWLLSIRAVRDRDV